MIKSRITFKQLEAFAFVVDIGTFRGAAAALGTTQPNISARIAAFEETLGTPLLYRDAGSVRLTAKGAVLLEKTRDILRAGEALLEEAARTDLIEERLRLGVTELVACTWLQPFLRELRQAYPSLRVELEVDLSGQIEDRLLEGQLDLALQNGPFRSDMSGSAQLTSESYVWVATPETATHLPPGQSVDRFLKTTVLTHAKHTVAGRTIHDWAQARGHDTSRIVHSSALSACVPMVCEGLGVALLPQSLIAAEVEAGRLTVLAADWAPPDLSFYARYDAERAPRFVTQACAIAAALRPPKD